MESLDIVENQLRAMAAITYPHDSWILDEGNDPAIKKMAARYGVKHFSRRGIEKYNQASPPFQAKTKAGNVNAWLDHVRKRKYDFFVQLDIDHLPKPYYLDKTLGYFNDPAVAWVQAPSVYKNLESLTARGAAEQELVLQGPLQMGFYGHSQTPFIIGSHCTYRMTAIREIGGFQPTRAEDHLDTLYLAYQGYHGIFVPEVIAEGDGPETFNTYLAQQFAWAYSMFQVLLYHTPKMVKTMPMRRKWQFLFAQTWYPLWSLSYLVMFMSPLAALLLNRNALTVSPAAMLVHFLPVYGCGFLVWWAARPIMQPHNLHLSWRGILLHAARWPIILRAIVAALFRVKKPYMITPKGGFAAMAPTVATYRPFLALGILSALSVVCASLFYGNHLLVAQVLFCLANALFMFIICIVDISLRLRQAKPRWTQLQQYWLRPILAALLLLVGIGGAALLTLLTIQPDEVVAQTTLHEKAVFQPVSYGMTTSQLMQQAKLVPQVQRALPDFGIYTQTPVLMNTVPHIQHFFVDWRDEHYLAFVLAQSLQAGNTPLITIEPRGQADGAMLLSAITKGVYDHQLQNIATVLAASANPVYIRFAHEMELTDVYPWGNQSPGLYIAAYRYVVNYLRTANTRFVWSPAGNQATASNYYPGDAYVDVIGTTVLYDQYWYHQVVPSFEYLVASRRWLQAYNKPVWIVEFGVGRADQLVQQQLIRQASSQFRANGFQALLYLDMKDANLNGPDYRLISPNDFTHLFAY